MPAILKGFYDRVFLSGFAFSYNNGRPKGLLKNKKALVFTTSGGPSIYQCLINGQRSLEVTAKDVLKFCGFKVKSYLFGSCMNINDNKKQEIEKKVNTMLSNF